MRSLRWFAFLALAAALGTSPTSAQSAGPEHIALGSQFGCGLDADGTVRCWGRNADGQLGSEGDDARTPRPVTGLTEVTKLGVGYGFACALRRDGSVWCWGDNGHHQLGVEGIEDRVQAAAVPGLEGVTDVAVGAFHVCVLRGRGRVACWGSNSQGVLLAPQSVEKRARPTEIAGIRGATAVYAGGYFSCAKDRRERLRCWGASAHGQSGTRQRVRRARPTRVRGADGAAQISLGGEQGCLLTEAGALSCWGSNLYGSNEGQGSYYATPQTIEHLPRAQVIRTRSENFCAVSEGRVYCWGVNRMHQLHVPTDETGMVVVHPSALPGVEDATDVAIGWYHQCARRQSGAWVCWGRNANGAVGVGSRDAMIATPTALPW